MPSATVEDYIKHIYLVSEKRTSGDVADVADVAMGQVAEALGVVPGTATTMVKALSDAGLVEYAPRVDRRQQLPLPYRVRYRPSSQRYDELPKGR